MPSKPNTPRPKKPSRPRTAPPPPVEVAEEARPTYGRGRPVGSKAAEPSRFTERVWASVTPEQKRALELLLLTRKQADPTLPLRWGLSDLIRELLSPHFAGK